jgi:hypothetical protein
MHGRRWRARAAALRAPRARLASAVAVPRIVQPRQTRRGRVTHRGVRASDCQCEVSPWSLWLPRRCQQQHRLSRLPFRWQRHVQSLRAHTLCAAKMMAASGGSPCAGRSCWRTRGPMLQFRTCRCREQGMSARSIASRSRAVPQFPTPGRLTMAFDSRRSYGRWSAAPMHKL